jgi:hypothetical protein
MNEFEDELRSALRRREAPAGFAARVRARTGAKSSPHRWGWLAAAVAACVLITAGDIQYRRYEGRKASRQLLAALEIAGSKLSIAQERVYELNRRTIHE